MSELPEGWAEATLLELAGPEGVVTDGDWVESKDQDPDGEIRLTQLADIGDSKFLNRSSRFLNRETAERLRCTYLQDGDLLIARMPDPLGRACIFPGVGQPAVTAVDVFIWRADELGVDARWVMHFVNSPDLRARIESEASGTTRQRIAGGKLKELTLPVPPLAEQQRIVAKLDQLLSRTARARTDLDRISILIAKFKEALLAAAFSGELTREWRDAEGLPEAEHVPLGTLITEIRYGTAQKCYPELEGVAVLRIPNVSSGRIDLDDLKYTNLKPREFDRLRLVAGDILVVRSNGSVDLVGRPALVTEAEAGLAYAGYLIRLRPDQNRVVPSYLSRMLEAPDIRRIVETGARSTSGVHNINSGELAALTVPRRELVEQHEIVRRVDIGFANLDRLTREYARAARLLPKLDQAILAQAFSGELVPQDPRDEPASELLARIRATGGEKPHRRRARKPRNIVPRAPRERAAMTKSRYDDDVRNKPYLADLLRQTAGSGSVEDLFRRADLAVADFYKQLKWEVDSGHIHDKKERLDAA